MAAAEIVILKRQRDVSARDRGSSRKQQSMEAGLKNVEKLDAPSLGWSAQAPTTRLSVDNALCQRCGSLDLDDLLSDKNSMKSLVSHRVMKLRKLGVRLKDGKCPLCKLFNRMKPNSQDEALNPYFALHLVRPPGLIPLSFGQALAVSSSASKDKGFKASHMEETGVIGEVHTEEPPGSRQALLVRSLDQCSIDFKVIHGWRDTCKDMHGSKCGRSPSTAPRLMELKMIDCETKKVVSWPQQAKYAALSYVWGKSEKSSADYVDDGGLPKKLPLTIEDAIRVTEQWGLRDMWVDRYCIDMNDDNERHSQILQMNRVYQSAELTIIAAAGDNADFGLPGISERSRLSQPAVKIGDRQLASTLTDPRKVLLASKWMQRGWTYQEGFFSVRGLIFTEEQVIFECPEGMAYESIVEFMHTSESGLLSRMNNEDQSPWKITEHLSQYSGRELSFSSDTITAFLGIFSEYESRRNPVYQYLGIPIMPRFVTKPGRGLMIWNQSQTVRFAAGLCWRNSGFGSRRLQFPSWTWAGWDAPLTYGIPECAQGLQIRKDIAPQVFIEDLQGSLKDFDQYDICELQDLVLDHHRFIHLEAWTLNLKIWHLPHETKQIQNPQLTPSFPKNCSEHFAVFDDAKTVVYLPLVLLDDKAFSAKWQDSMLGGINDLWHGVILGRSQNLFDNYRDDSVFIMVIEDHGDHFERIGHMEIQPWSLQKKRDERKKRPTLRWKDMASWQLCFRSKKRRRFRLG